MNGHIIRNPMLLGCVLAGGMSSRFGSDKALAVLNGRSLLDHAIWRIEPWCGAVVVAGRDRAPVACVPDWPKSGMGPLGGLAGALRHAAAKGFTEVLCCGVDSIGLPHDLPDLLAPSPACLSAQPVIGRWPVTVLPQLEAVLGGAGKHSLHRLAEAANARLVETPIPPENVNTPADLDRLRGR